MNNYCNEKQVTCINANMNGECTITACNRLFNYSKDIRLGVPCIICSETVTLTDMETMSFRHGGSRSGIKVCEKCKKAIMYIRSKL